MQKSRRTHLAGHARRPDICLGGQEAAPCWRLVWVVKHSVHVTLATPLPCALHRFDTGCMGDQPIANASLPMPNPEAPPLPPECELPMA